MNILIIFFIFIPILAFILLALNLLLAIHKPDESKVSAYECGFSPVYGQTRSTFQIHFYIVAMLFLIFDLEILLLFPIAVTLYQVSIFGLSIALIFFIVLTIGFILEIGTGAIKLSSLNTYKNFTEVNPLIINL
jgi:NADH:ubiquinone oxidoreductase subunit 3 (subunit A)